ncbi:MAG TPA: hypothetical protein VK010_01435, partial [Flavobacteriaceae bacterium]|nr:hypothetical protein [Flavobacteriaceae bacterium]
RGEKLEFSQNDLSIKGHALELRVYAEDPLNNFLPSTGKLERYRLPHGENIRVDDGFSEGMEVPIYYDPMLAKLITYGKSREEAIQLMEKAIEDYEIKGVETTLSFGKFVCQHEAFRKGDFDTHFVNKHFSAEKLEAENREEAKIAALLALKSYLKAREIVRLPHNR